MSEKPPDAEIGWESIRILKIIEDHGGKATTSEIKNVAGYDSTDPVNYRKNKHLEPRGLIDSYQPPADGPGPYPPQELTLTEDGSDFLEDLEEGSSDETRSIGDRVEQVENELSAVREKLAEIETGGNSDNSDSGSGHVSQEQFGETMSQIEGIKRQVNDIKTSLYFDDRYREQSDSATIVAAIMKEKLVDEHGEEWFNEQVEKQRTRDDLKLLEL